MAESPAKTEFILNPVFVREILSRDPETFAPWLDPSDFIREDIDIRDDLFTELVAPESPRPPKVKTTNITKVVKTKPKRTRKKRRPWCARKPKDTKNPAGD